MVTFGIVIGLIAITQGHNEFQPPANSSLKLISDGRYLILLIMLINTDILFI